MNFFKLTIIISIKNVECSESTLSDDDSNKENKDPNINKDDESFDFEQSSFKYDDEHSSSQEYLYSSDDGSIGSIPSNISYDSHFSDGDICVQGKLIHLLVTYQ